MRDGILTCDNSAVGEAGGDVMGEICIDCWKDGYVWRDGADAGEEVYRTFEATREQPGTVIVNECQILP